MEVKKKKKKKLEIQELACANLFIIILISLSNGKKGTPMNSGTIVMRCEKKRTLIVHNCTPAPESSAPATVPLPSADIPSLKRRTADPTSEIPLPKHHQNEDPYNCKPSGSQAMVDMASSIDRLASSVAGPNVTLASSPERKRAAIKLIEKDEDLSGDELTKTFKLI